MNEVSVTSKPVLGLAQSRIQWVKASGTWCWPQTYI